MEYLSSPRPLIAAGGPKQACLTGPRTAPVACCCSVRGRRSASATTARRASAQRYPRLEFGGQRPRSPNRAPGVHHALPAPLPRRRPHSRRSPTNCRFRFVKPRLLLDQRRALAAHVAGRFRRRRRHADFPARRRARLHTRARASSPTSAHRSGPSSFVGLVD